MDDAGEPNRAGETTPARKRSPRRRGRGHGEYRSVYQFKVTLKETELAIWRRIQVPQTYSFWDLHVAIQDAMAWKDYHLHVFRMRRQGKGEEKMIGIPDEEWEEEFPTLPGWRERIADWFTLEHPLAEYEYDFGDSWEPEIRLDKVLPRDPNVPYPVCIEGELLAPPEDVGGVGGYYDFLEAVRNPHHPEHEEWRVWAGGAYDPESFDPKKAKFDDPRQRWSIAFETMGEEI